MNEPNLRNKKKQNWTFRLSQKKTPPYKEWPTETPVTRSIHHHHHRHRGHCPSWDRRKEVQTHTNTPLSHTEILWRHGGSLYAWSEIMPWPLLLMLRCTNEYQARITGSVLLGLVLLPTKWSRVVRIFFLFFFVENWCFKIETYLRQVWR